MSFLSGAGSLIGGLVGGPAGAAIGGGVGNAVSGFTQGWQGAQQGNLATAGNTDKQQKIIDFAKANNIGLNEISDHAQQLAQQDAAQQQRMGMQNPAIQNQLQQDIERSRAYNTLATQGQQLASNNAANLANAYTNARAQNAQLMQAASQALGVR